MGKMVGAGAEIFDKLEPEPHKNGPAPQHLTLSGNLADLDPESSVYYPLDLG
jgi:hypothetical protein